MMVRDDADIVETTIRHLLYHTDEVLVVDHRSVDGTREILESLPVELWRLEEHGFSQERVMNELAARGLSVDRLLGPSSS